MVTISLGWLFARAVLQKLLFFFVLLALLLTLHLFVFLLLLLLRLVYRPSAAVTFSAADPFFPSNC